MVQSTIDRVPRGEYVPEADRRVVLYNLDWKRFEQLLEVRGDRSGPRMAYLDGAVEIMSPSRTHDSISRRIGLLISTYLLEVGIVFDATGSWLLKHAPDEAGVEPDESYVLHYDPNGPETERPELAVEVVWTSGGLNKLEIYRRLGVPEVWFRIDGAIAVHVLGPDGYALAPRSAQLPDLDLGLLCRLLELPTPNEAVRELRAWVAGRK